MADITKLKLNVNRVIAFLAGGLIVLAVMAATVVSTANTKNEELTKALDASLYDPGKLLSAAKADYIIANYARAKSELATLLEKHPGSPEAAEGKPLYDKVVSEAASMQSDWEAAAPAIQKAWSANLAAELRAKSETARAEFEKGLADTVNHAWDQAKEQIRTDWEKSQQSGT